MLNLMKDLLIMVSDIWMGDQMYLIESIFAWPGGD